VPVIAFRLALPDCRGVWPAPGPSPIKCVWLSVEKAIRSNIRWHARDDSVDVHTAHQHPNQVAA
jgi:hypothetical protein